MNFSVVNAAALAANLPAFWFPAGKRYGLSLRAGNIQGEPGNSFWVCLRTGAWKDHASGEGGGDLISLFAARETISQGEAKQRLAAMLGTSSFNSVPDPGPVKRTNSDLAKTLWQQAEPIVGSSAAMYLAGRNISQFPLSLRFHPEAYHGPTRAKYPAMVAAVTRWPVKVPNAVHRTFLQENTKAAIDPCRMMLGEISGGAVRLAPVDAVMAVGEGIESCLSYQLLTGIPTWAVLSASNYRELILPDTAREITIAADHDEIGLNKAHEAAELWTRRGRKVRVAFPPVKGEDFNDVLKGQTR